MNKSGYLIKVIVILLLGLVTAEVEGWQGRMGILLQGEAGFDGYHKDGDWFPLNITIVNSGDWLLGGELVVSAPVSLTNTQQRYQQRIDLAANSETEFVVYIQSDKYRGDIFVQLNDQNGHLISKIEVEKPEIISPSSFFYGIVTANSEEWDYLRQLPNRREDQPIAFLTVADLPDTAVPWRNFNLIILNGVDTTELSDGQIEAIRFWVESGGTLVVTGGVGAGKTTAGLADLVSINLSGQRAFADLPFLEAAAGTLFRDPPPYLLSLVAFDGGTVLLAQDETPLLIEQERGMGLIYFLALDPLAPPLLDWDGNEWLWQEIIAKTELNNGRKTKNDLYYARHIIEGNQKGILPSSYLLARFLFFYLIILGPINYYYLKGRNRLKLIWVTVPLISFFFTFSTIFIGFQNRGDQIIVRQLSLYEGSIGNKQLLTRHLSTIYSPWKDEYQIQFASESFVQQLSSDLDLITGYEREGAPIWFGDEVETERFLIQAGDRYGFVVTELAPTPAITGKVQFDFREEPPLINVQLGNGEAISLTKALLVSGNLLIYLPDLEVGGIYDGAFAYSNELEQEQHIQFNLIGSELAEAILLQSSWDHSRWYRERKLVQSIESRYFDPDYLANHALLIFWTEDEALSFELDQEGFWFDGRGLYLLEVPLELIQADWGEEEIPAVLLTEDRLGKYDRYQEELILCQNQYVEIRYGVAFNLGQQLDRLVVDLEVEDISLLEMQLWDWDQKVWELVVGGGDGGHFEIEDEGTFLNGKNEMKIRLDNLGAVCVTVDEVSVRLGGMND